MAASSLTAQPLGQQGGFNWVFLVDLIVCGILALFFLFYFNRLFATAISYGIRAYTWHKYRAYIDITSLQISLLGGRLFFKSIRYHGHNQTVFVHDGRITWRYWLRQVREAEVFQKKKAKKDRERSEEGGPDNIDEKPSPRSSSGDDAETGNLTRQSALPCRLYATVSGVEAFLYNQSPVYDNIVNNLAEGHGANVRSGASESPVQSPQPDPKSEKESALDDFVEAQKTRSSISESFIARSASRNDEETSLPAFLRLFPIQIDCKKAAAVVGSEHTPSIVTAKLENASGRIDADEAASLEDLYKLLFNFDFNNILVSLKPNHDFQMLQLQAAARMETHDDPQEGKKARGMFGFHPWRRIRKILHSARRVLTFGRSSKQSAKPASLLSNDDGVELDPPQMPDDSRWEGLARYLEDTGDNQSHEWDDVEYARFSTLVDCKKVGMTFHWDTPGKVRQYHGRDLLSLVDEVNGTQPPDYGLHLTVDGGIINYGPWADRQRIVLQNMFFPGSYHDAAPTKRLAVDQIRLATVFKLHLCLESDVVLRIPTREPSKDWKWQGRTETYRESGTEKPGLRKRRGKHSKKFGKSRKQHEGAAGVDARPFGWMDLKVLANSTVNYAMDMYARKDGYHNSLDLDIKGTEITSSVNHALLWRAGHLELDADLSNPLKWNALRQWSFNIRCHDLDLFILRDHLFLLIDLISDWATGPPPDFYTFVPFAYSLALNFENFNLFLNSNDANIVNDPSDLEENNFLILRGESLGAKLEIPIDQYRPTQSGITFDVLARNMCLDLTNSTRITLHNLLRHKRLAKLKKLTLSGSHTYFVEQAPELTDVLQMDICGTDLELQLFGFLIRHFVNVKENYFGEFLHFKTLEEYQDNGGEAANGEANMAGRHAFRPANDLDVILCIVTEHPVIMIPSNIYSAESFIKAELPTATVDLRVTNYYLDLATDISPISISWSSKVDGMDQYETSTPQIIIDRTSFSGHRLFGLPPTEPAYVSNWDVEVGNISGECSLDFVQQIAKAGRAFAFAMDDKENALPLAQTVPIPEATFVRLNTGTVCLWLNEGEAAIRIFSEPVTMTQNDLTDSIFSSRLSLNVPTVSVVCVDAITASRERHLKDRHPGACMAFVETGIELTMVTRKARFQTEREKQQHHIRRQDAKSNRAQFLLDEGLLRINTEESDGDEGDDVPPAMALPVLPQPLVHMQEEQHLSNISPERHMSRTTGSSSEPSQLAQGSSSHRAKDRGASISPVTNAGLTSEPGQGATLKSLWSPFAVPDPHFAEVHVDLSRVPAFSISADETERQSPLLDDDDDNGVNLDQDDNLDHSTFMVRLRPGLRVYIEPRMSDPILNIVSTLLPKHPSDVIDAFQMDVMGQVSNVEALKKSRGGITELNLIVPTVDGRLYNDQSVDIIQPESAETHPDQLDLNLTDLNLTLRFRATPPDQNTNSATVLQSSTILHLTLQSALVELWKATSGSTDKENAIRLGVDDVLVWLALSRSKSIHVSFRDLVAAVSGHQSTYLTSVFSRYAVIGTSIQKKVDAVSDGARTRLRYLTDFLTKHAGNSNDPPYLSRMTYVLRAFPEHFRNQDSWKIVARFRHIFESLSGERRNELDHQMIGGYDCPNENDNAAILRTWAEWCSWDIPNIERTQVFKILLGDIEPEPLEADLRATELTLKSNSVRLLVETRKRSSEISLGTLSIGLHVIPPSQPSGLMLVEENIRTKTVLQAGTGGFVLRLNWDILESVEQFIDIYFRQVAQTLDTLPANQVQRHAGDGEEALLREDFHIVLSTDEGSVELHGMNVRQVSSIEGMRMSLIGTSRASQAYGQCFSALLTANHAFTELHDLSHKIWRTDITTPSIYADYREKLKGDAAVVNVGGSYGQLHVVTEREVVGLLEIVDSVLASEVVYVKNLQKRIASQQSQAPTRQKSSTPQQDLHLNVALFAGKFSLNVALLKACKLSVSGETANVRVRPSLGPDKAFDIEMHLGPMEIALVRREKGSKGQRAIFRTPPVTADLGIRIFDRSIDVNLNGVLQEITVEATSVQSVLSIINRPEVRSVLEAVRDQISDLRERAAGILADEAPVVANAVAEKPKTVVYDMNTTIAGFQVIATAPVLTAAKAQAELTFGFGAVQARISNNGLKESKAIPNIHATIQNIGATLTVVEKGIRRPCGHVSFSVTVDCTSDDGNANLVTREVKARSDALDINIFAETASTVVDIATHVQQKILDLDLSKEVEYLRRLRRSRETRAQTSLPKIKIEMADEMQPTEGPSTVTNFSLDLRKIRLIWVVKDSSTYGENEISDLELSLTRIHLAIQRQNEARLSIENMQLQVIPKDHKAFDRSENSALLPEVVFTVGYETTKQGIRIAFQAAGKALDLRLDSGFVAPVSLIQKSGELAVDRYHAASVNWQTESTPGATTRKSPFGDKRLLSLQADASFAGALVYIQGEAPPKTSASLRPLSGDLSRVKSRGKPGKADLIATSLRVPGIALKIEYSDRNAIENESTLNGELKVDASTNTVYPEMVPIIMQISDGVKDVVRSAEKKRRSTTPPKTAQQTHRKSVQMLREDDSLLSTDPSAFFGKTKLNLGLRICRQEFGLSCQPIARVNAKAQIDDIYVTMNTIDSEQFGHFFAISATISRLGASVQHVYSRESTLSFDVESLALSLMNSKHLSGGPTGVSAVLQIAPTKTALNVRQIQDLLLFREIWFPPEFRDTSYSTPSTPIHEPEEMFVQKYHQVSSAAAFPWNATVSITDLVIDLELGQSIGKSSFNVTNLWASSKKLSSGKQDLCLGIDDVGMKSTGRMSGFVELSQLSVRTSIEWPSFGSGIGKAPLIQAAVGFGKLRAKASFDYQPFAFADIEAFDFLMYNVRDSDDSPDRLVAILKGDKVFAFCTATSPAQAVGLYQAFNRLIQEKQEAFNQSMSDLAKHLQRRSVSQPYHPSAPAPQIVVQDDDESKFPITLHTDVVVMLRAINIGAFPNTFFDKQILKLEASEMQARFAVGLEDGKIHSNLGMTLGQLQVALASVKRVNVPKSLGDISIDEVIVNASTAKGGTILRVPKVVASMQTWQLPSDHHIEFIFKSSFVGKVDIGWNYSRISFIRGMWTTYSRSLASRLGEALPESAVKIKTGPEPTDPKTADPDEDSGKQGKITAVVKLPHSRYDYTALEPPIIETPQLRDMGEATPPLEWMGLHRDRLPNVIHQILIVTLLEVAKEVEDAYGRILGSS